MKCQVLSFIWNHVHGISMNFNYKIKTIPMEDEGNFQLKDIPGCKRNINSWNCVFAALTGAFMDTYGY